MLQIVRDEYGIINKYLYGRNYCGEHNCSFYGIATRGRFYNGYTYEHFQGRLPALYMSLGMALSVCIHASYSIAGLAVVIANSAWLFSAIKYLGATYLVYLALQLLTSRDILKKGEDSASTHMSSFNALRAGFTCNILNPKTSIFFLSIFTQVVSIDTPLIMQASYGLIIILAHFIWYSGVTLLLSHPGILPYFNKHKQKIDKIAGFVLMIIAIKLALANYV